MCRKNLVLAAAMIGFGAGLLLGLCVESWLLKLILAVVTILIGVGLLKKK